MMLDGDCDRLGATADPKFAQDVAHVEIDRRAANDELIGDDSVTAALFHQREDIAFSPAQIVARG